MSEDDAAEAAVIGQPAIVAAPAATGLDPERPRPIAGAGATAIGELVAKFLPAYLAASGSRELAYLTAPRSTIVPLDGAVETESVGNVDQLGDGEGPTRELIVSARVHDPVVDAIYPVSYRLRVALSSGRWYVVAVEGAVA
ncbi:MAG TPA: conjugal transfer protein [Candidatus Methylacidiphilales bacterium]